MPQKAPRNLSGKCQTPGNNQSRDKSFKSIKEAVCGIDFYTG
jgi:hypothetical protein